MKQDIITTYLDEIGRTRRLTLEEERDLSERISRGEKRALDRLVESNLRLVVAVAKQYQDRGLAMEDLISEGNLGLIRAAERYKVDISMPFAPFASPIIRQRIEKALNIYVDTTATGNADSIGRKPDSSSALADDAVESSDRQLFTEQALQRLPEREREVIMACFGIGRHQQTMAEVAAAMHLTRERVRQIRKRALRRLRA